MSEIIQQHIHQQFVSIAKSLSPKLEDAIAQVGPLQFSPNQDSPFPERLCRTIVGQQLSVKAAAAIWNRIVASAEDIPLIEHLVEVAPDSLRVCGL